MTRPLQGIFRSSLVLILSFTFLLGLVYPGVGMLMARALFPKEAKGSLILVGDKLYGSMLLGQGFTGPRYFHPRPSAGGYDGLRSGGSNHALGNKAYLQVVKERAAILRKENPGAATPVPVDLVTASGSGLDPHISVAGAQWQVPRVAKQRKMPESAVYDLVHHYTEPRQFGILGEPVVNVLLLNMALDLEAKAK